MAIIYQIKVEGFLKESWSEWFNGMTIAIAIEEDRSPITTLTGPVVDQTALHGLLNRIRDLGLPLLYLSQIETDQQPSIKVDHLNEDYNEGNG